MYDREEKWIFDHQQENMKSEIILKEEYFDGYLQKGKLNPYSFFFALIIFILAFLDPKYFPLVYGGFLVLFFRCNIVFTSVIGFMLGFISNLIVTMIVQAELNQERFVLLNFILK